MHVYYAEWNSIVNEWFGYTPSMPSVKCFHDSAATALQNIKTVHEWYLGEPDVNELLSI